MLFICGSTRILSDIVVQLAFASLYSIFCFNGKQNAEIKKPVLIGRNVKFACDFFAYQGMKDKERRKIACVKAAFGR